MTRSYLILIKVYSINFLVNLLFSNSSSSSSSLQISQISNLILSLLGILSSLLQLSKSFYFPRPYNQLSTSALFFFIGYTLISLQLFLYKGRIVEALIRIFIGLGYIQINSVLIFLFVSLYQRTLNELFALNCFFGVLGMLLGSLAQYFFEDYLFGYYGIVFVIWVVLAFCLGKNLPHAEDTAEENGYLLKVLGNRVSFK